MWWGGFLLAGLLLILISVPFFSFPKVLTHEKEKIRLMEKEAADNSNSTSATNHNSASAKVANSITKDDTGYGKDIKGLYYE